MTDLASDLRLGEVLDKMVARAIDLCPGREVALLIVGEDGLTVARTSALGPGARRGLESWARDSADVMAEPLAVDDLESHPALARLGVRLGKSSLLAQPLLFKRRSLGLVVVLATADAPIDDDERELLSAFTEQAAVALANAHLFQTLLDNATRDPLTDLPNRREFDRVLARELERSGRYGEIFSLAILDLDGFKELNDSRGHAAGDELLAQAADTIREACRAADVAARIGGDEFAVLLPRTNQFEAAAMCERLRAEIETLADVSLSWGIAEYPTHGVKRSTLMRAADGAMYASKPKLVGGERLLTRSA